MPSIITRTGTGVNPLWPNLLPGRRWTQRQKMQEMQGSVSEAAAKVPLGSRVGEGVYSRLPRPQALPEPWRRLAGISGWIRRSSSRRWRRVSLGGRCLQCVMASSGAPSRPLRHGEGSFEGFVGWVGCLRLNFTKPLSLEDSWFLRGWQWWWSPFSGLENIILVVISEGVVATYAAYLSSCSEDLPAKRCLIRPELSFSALSSFLFHKNFPCISGIRECHSFDASFVLLHWKWNTLMEKSQSNRM